MVEHELISMYWEGRIVSNLIYRANIFLCYLNNSARNGS